MNIGFVEFSAFKLTRKQRVYRSEVALTVYVPMIPARNNNMNRI